jgi:DNA-directed RNA polymerase sigma subunit (sigma70/sigma32)
MSKEVREELRGLAGVTASLDQPASADSATTLGDLVAPSQSDWVGDVEQTMMDNQVQGALAKLTKMQRDVLTRRFGLDGTTPLSLQATATVLDIGVRRVRRAEEEALATLKGDTAILAARAIS